MDDFPIDKIQISGASLASLLHRASSAVGDTHGYLFSHAAVSTSNPLSDHPHHHRGHLTSRRHHHLLPLPPVPPPPPAAACFRLHLPSGLVLRPAQNPSPPLLEGLHRRSLSLLLPLSSLNSPKLHPLSPSISLRPHQHAVSRSATHQYKAFQYRGGAFEPKSMCIVNIGPSFRSQYDSFSPSVPFPLMDCELRWPKAMVEDEIDETLAGRKDQLKNQKQLDSCAQGFEIGRLSKLMGSEAAYTAEMEELYDKMLAKIDALSRLVEQSNAKVLEQETRNMKLRSRVAGLE